MPGQTGLCCRRRQNCFRHWRNDVGARIQPGTAVPCWRSHRLHPRNQPGTALSVVRRAGARGTGRRRIPGSRLAAAQFDSRKPQWRVESATSATSFLRAMSSITCWSRDALERYGEDAQLGSGRLAVLIECGGSGYLKIGPAIEAMEAEAEGLGAAFYWTLTHALYKVMRLYNHDDALMYEEQMHEYAAEDDEENQGQYEFPEVEKALPECIRKTLKRDYPRRQGARPGIAAAASQRALQGLDRPVAPHRATGAASPEAIEGVPRRGPLRPAAIAVPACLFQRARRHRGLFRRREPVDARMLVRACALRHLLANQSRRSAQCAADS